MPKSFLKSQAPPDVPVKNWLAWSTSMLEERILDANNKIAGIMGINKAGDLTHLIMPTIVPNAIGDDSAILSNSYDASNEPSLIYIDTSDFGFSAVIKKYSDIPNEIRPEEPLASKFFRGTSWESATAELGLACFPMVVPVLFGMEAIEASIHNDDFEEKLEKCRPSTPSGQN